MENIPIRNITTVPQESILSDSFSIRDVQEVFGGKDSIQDTHRHTFFYMLALQKGAGSHEIDFIPYEVSDNTIFFMRPGQVHKLTLKAGSTGYLMQFTIAFYSPQDHKASHVLRRVGSINSYQFNDQNFEKLFSVLRYIFQEYTDQQEGFQEVIKANLGICFIKLLRQNNQKSSASTNLYGQERLEELLELLETHATTHKQVSDYADMLNLSVYQLNAITKSMLGKTCSELITDYCILEAKRYLLATSNQVNQIAYYLGYEDTSYFIRFFKKHTGYSPEAFRHNFR
ncbi:AraC family transcriptional regulator [Xanthocytophaga flava]|uniref:AraC family transcriptional regulator n=1 Tax=Xanthocytophaga flava TaxID=3048013 RepID=UPI0028D05A6D|nr:AraC family transcriptional regulator [Xanthocytophaga flavus]MDJ1469102.1 AraC family transcriptional regulator [Xanthocytophaga flavus]